MKIFSIIIYLALTLARPEKALGQDQSSNDLFRRAAKELENNNFDQALNYFNTLINKGHFAPELFLKIGNAHYKKNNIGKAVLAYKRAILLSPNLPEARQNLKFLKESQAFIDFEKSTFETFINRIPLSAVSWILVTSLWMIGAGITFRILQPKSRILSIALIAAGFSMFFLSFFTSRHQDKSKLQPNSHIITSTNALIRSSPNDTASTVRELSSGSDVIVISERSNWSYIEAPDNLRGWIRKDYITKTWPYEMNLIP